MKVVLIVSVVGILGGAAWLRVAGHDAGAPPSGGTRSAPQVRVATTPPPAQFANLMTGHDVRRPPRPAPVALHRPFKDPVFGTCITRVSDASQMPDVQRIRHYYSKANPFNVDNTRAILWASNGGYLLYDTKTWKPIDYLHIGTSDAEISWHPTNPNVYYHVDMVKDADVRAMCRYDLKANSKKQLHDFSEYRTARSRLEGNMDAKGRYYAMIGTRSEQDVDIFVYDVDNDKIVARQKVHPRIAGDWVSMSQSGKYVVAMGNDRSRVYDVNLKPVVELPKGSFGHGDLCMTADGRDLLVYDGADHELDNNRNINVADLQTGKVTIGTRIGWKSTPHVSCRNLDLPGWALISTQGPDGKYPNHDFEIFWLKLDGSGEVRRVAHHHSSREDGGYFAEQHAVTNRNGTMILFASNWGAEKVNDYLVDLRPGACGGQQPPPKQ